jgi:hypothetical protein
MSAAPDPITGSRPARARSTMRCDELGVPGPPHQVRADRQHGQRGGVRGQRLRSATALERE